MLFVLSQPVAITVFLAVSAEPKSASKLPTDGAWATYYVNRKVASESDRNWRRTIRFIKTITENGQKLRWIEIVDVVDGQDTAGGKRRKYKDIHRFLIPEKALKQSKNPLRDLVRGWSSLRGKPRRNFEDLKRSRQVYDWTFGPALAFLPGQLKSATPTKKSKTIDYQKGQLRTATGFRGTHTASFRPENPALRYRWKSDLRLWLHKSVPIRMAAGEFHTLLTIHNAKGKEVVRRTATSTYTIEAWGRK